MNVDTLNSKYKVVSKYFAGKAVMDESLSDFKEKKSFKVNNNKAPPAKPKAKKIKRVRGQKDIRSVLQPKKNELVVYAEDFDTVCKKSGIDVDSEQLQLAIALSKSLQTTDPADSSSLSSKSLTTQQRTGLIRTTLKEYGFKVPEKPTTSKKTKKRRKPYKLLLTSDEEKQQIISDRYSQVLFELNNLKTPIRDKDIVLPNLFIYNMATNIEYDNIKDDDVFYVEDIVEKSPNNMGCLLKNWSDIPGRLTSPDLNKSELLFSEVECSQEELNIVLSGSLKNTKDILKKKKLLKDRRKSIHVSPIKRNISQIILDTSPDCIENMKETHSSPVFPGNSSTNNFENAFENCKESSTLHGNKENKLLVVTQPSRSLSPDLFDDEDDIAIEPNETMTETEIEPANNATKQTSEVMDLTECVIHAQENINSNIIPVSQLSQQIDVTKRKSNDFMEMTECIGTAQNILEKIDEEIDLTGPCEDIVTIRNNTYVEDADEIECVSLFPYQIVKEVQEHIDLTAKCENYSKTKENSPCKSSTVFFIEGRTNEHIDLTEYCVDDVETKSNSAGAENADNIENMDLTQSSNSSNDTLPCVYIGGTQAVPDKSLDDTIILNEKDYLEIKSPEIIKELHDSDNEQTNQDPNIPKSQDSSNDMISPKHMSVDITDDTITTDKNTDEVPIIDLDETCKEPEANDDNVDLTQTSDSNEAPAISNNTSCQINYSSLGRKDNVSVDYDEALENMNSFPYYDNDNYDNNTIMTEEQPQNDSKHNNLNSPSKNIENNFEFGGISVIDNLSSFNSKSRDTISIPNGSLRDSLPMVNIKGTCSERPKSPLKHDPEYSHKNKEKPETITKTPKQKVNRNINVETPENSEYIVKTDNVTPMLDYASMSTPERNRELDKYGLKPFKRKRAIQLLTHLYNQTHPYVESTEELPSPSKKRKTSLSQPKYFPPSSSTSTQLPKKAKSQKNTSRSPRDTSRSPRKTSRSPRRSVSDGNLNDSDNENDLFMVTREVPVIRNVECDADDWVFQKREKAKLHSCRVPLHIAFHNFVSCRAKLHEAILRYEPVNIDIIHKELAASGHRYDPKDLLKFLDKRCITVRTADNTKNSKKY